jgi:hypothetical protein
MLDALQAPAKRGHIAVTVLLEEAIHTFSCGRDESFSSASRLEIGCIAKTLTATAIAIAAAENKLLITDPVAKYFPNVRRIDASLRVFHLVNQSHGLDGSALQSIPYQEDGSIDAEMTWNAVLNAPPFAPPGELFYNYGSAGLWIAAAVLQRIYGTTFWSILNEKLLSPIGVQIAETEGRNFCPANGKISLSADELLKVCEFHLGTRNTHLQEVLAEFRTYRMPVPSWPPIAKASCPGWLCHGPAYGSYGNRQDSSLMMLISPEERAAIVISARRVGPIYLAQRALFGNLFNSEEQTPRPLTKAERDAMPVENFVGKYQKGRYLLDVSSNSKGDIQASVYPRDSNGEVGESPIVSRSMIPALANTLYPSPPEPNVISFLRFLRETPEGAFQCVTTGKHMFRRK